MSEADIGVYGMGVMGSNLAMNIAEKGYTVAIGNRAENAHRIDQALREAGPLADRMVPNAQLADFVGSIKRPRAIILMIKAGWPVDAMIEKLLPLLEEGDAIIDAGNSLFTDTRRRFDMLAQNGIGYLGVGVSGGEEGARHGPSIMVGGSKTQWHHVENILKDISAKFEGEPCVAYLGDGGAGHFVKTVHNGIEYADMQMIAEVYGVMRDGLGMDPKAAAKIFAEWNKGPLNSYLIEITSYVLAEDDAETGRPLVELIKDQAGQKGTGRWSAIAAQELGVPATTIEGAVAARSLSALKDQRVEAQRIYGPPQGQSADMEIEALERALLAGKIAAYAQGFAIMESASNEYGWNLPLGTVARIWRAGCIIRSRFLDDMAAAYEKSKVINLMTAPHFVEIMKQNHMDLRQMVAAAALGEFPVPCLASALNYFDGYRQAQGTANVIQGLRDFFGAHGFEIEGRQGAQHGDWSHEAIG